MLACACLYTPLYSLCVLWRLFSTLYLVQCVACVLLCSCVILAMFRNMCWGPVAQAIFKGGDHKQVRFVAMFRKKHPVGGFPPQHHFSWIFLWIGQLFIIAN